METPPTLPNIVMHVSKSDPNTGLHSEVELVKEHKSRLEIIKLKSTDVKNTSSKRAGGKYLGTADGLSPE